MENNLISTHGLHSVIPESHQKAQLHLNTTFHHLKIYLDRVLLGIQHLATPDLISGILHPLGITKQFRAIISNLQLQL